MTYLEKYAAKQLLIRKLASSFERQSAATPEIARRIAAQRRQYRIAGGRKGGTNMVSRTSQPYTQSLASGVSTPPVPKRNKNTTINTPRGFFRSFR